MNTTCEMGKYILAGGSGFIGSRITTMLLEDGHEVYILSTKKRVSNKKNCQYIKWNPAEGSVDESVKIGECILINLAGAGVADKRWTNARKFEIVNSRTDSITMLCKMMEKKIIEPIHVVSTSAIGFYGEKNVECNEKTVGDDSFLSTTCLQWEEAANKFLNYCNSLSIVRVGIVLGNEGGALKELIKSYQFGLAAIPGNGKQIYSWIHLDDICRLYYFLADNKINGTYNGVAPYYTSVNDMFGSINKFKKKIIQMHIPDAALKLLLGEMSIEVLKSCKVNSSKIVNAGFEFQFPTMESAMKNLLS